MIQTEAPMTPMDLENLRSNHCIADDATDHTRTVESLNNLRSSHCIADDATDHTRTVDSEALQHMIPRSHNPSKADDVCEYASELLPVVEEEPGSAQQWDRDISKGDEYVDDTVPMDHGEIQRRNKEASDCALRGNERVSIKLFKTTLKTTTNEVARIQRRMEYVSKDPDYLRLAVYKLLNEEWTTVALTIAETKTMMAILYERVGDYDRSLRCCNEAREVYERQTRRNNSHQSNVNPNSASEAKRMMQMAEKLAEAEESFAVRKELHEVALHIHREIENTEDLETKELLYDNLFDKLSAVLALEKRNLGSNHPQVSETFAFLSRIHLERADIDKAICAMEKAVLVTEVALGNLHPRTAEKYYELARQYECANRDKSDRANALLFYEKAIETYKEADGDHSKMIVSASNDIGVLRIQQGQHEEAIQRLSDALAIHANSNENSDAISADTAQVWRNLAECYVLQGEWDMAAMNFESALQVQEDARELFETFSSNNPDLDMPPLIQDESIADTLKRLGKTFAAKNEYGRANEALLEALTLFQMACEQAKGNKEIDASFDQAKKQDQVANIIFCLAEVKGAEGKLEDAIRLYDESLELRVYSDKLRPKGEKQNRVHSAMCLNEIGTIRMAKKQHILAFKNFNEAIQCTRQHDLPDNHPIVKMLWENSKRAAEEMANTENLPPKAKSRGSEVTVESHSTTKEHTHTENKRGEQNGKDMAQPNKVSGWFQTAARLEKKAQQKKKKGDIHGSIQTTMHVLEFRRAYLAKRQESKKTTERAKQQIARTLVTLAHLRLVQGEEKIAENHLREGLQLFQSSGLSNDDDRILEIHRDLGPLRA